MKKEIAVATPTRKLITTHVKEVEGKDRVLEFVGSTEVRDRDSEVIKFSAWQLDKYIANPVVQWAHRYDEPPIGKTLSIRQNKKKETIFEIEFASKDTYEFADTIYKLCKGGFLSATSVGFIPLEWEDGKKEGDPRRTYTKTELLEISIVPVPSNPEALVSARDAGIISLKEFAFVTKPDSPLVTDEGNASTTVIKVRDVTKAPRLTSQDELRDELEYTRSLVEIVGISKEVKDTASSLAQAIAKSLELPDITQRLTGGDTSEMIKSPNHAMVQPVIKLLNDHHAAHNKCYEDTIKQLESMCEEDGEKGISEEDIQQIIAKTIEIVRRNHANSRTNC